MAILPFLRQPHRYQAARPPAWPFALNHDHVLAPYCVALFPLFGPQWWVNLADPKRSFSPMGSVTPSFEGSPELGVDALENVANTDIVSSASFGIHPLIAGSVTPNCALAIWFRGTADVGNNDHFFGVAQSGSSGFRTLQISGANFKWSPNALTSNAAHSDDGLTWQHVMTAYSRTAGEIYIDGELDITTGGAGTTFANMDRYTVGNIGRNGFGFDTAAGLCFGAVFALEASNSINRKIDPDALKTLADVGQKFDLLEEVGRVFYSIPTAGGPPTHEEAATLGASGNLTGISQADREAVATLGASGNLTGLSQVDFSAASALGASANLAAAAALVTDVAATLAASGNVSAGNDVSLEAAAVLAASANLAAANDLIAEVAATLGASGNVTGLSQVDFEGAATLGASANLIAVAALVTDVAATLAASGNVTATGEVTGDLDGAVTLGASLNLAAAADMVAETAATLGASGNVTAAAELLREAAANLAASTQITTTGTITSTVEVSATLAASANITSAMDYIAEAVATLGFSGNLSASTIATMLADANLAVSGDLTAIAPSTIEASAALLYSVNLTATGAAITTGLVTPDGRKVVILADTRTVTVLEDTRTILIH